MTDCLIIGAGPYGLLFGRASFGAWRRLQNCRNPDGRLDFDDARRDVPQIRRLRHPPSLSRPAPSPSAPIARLRASLTRIPGVPVRKDTFVAYGLAFQRQYVPSLEARTAVAVSRHGDGFTTEFADGGRITSRRVISARRRRALWRNSRHRCTALPASLCSHSSQNNSFAQFAGRSVVVIGGGSSAMDTAAALRRQGASVTVVARRSSVRFQTPLGKRTLRDKIRAPMTVLGPGWKSVLCTRAPLLFHHMPDDFRTKVVTRYLGPAPAWFVPRRSSRPCADHHGYDCRRRRGL